MKAYLGGLVRATTTIAGLLFLLGIALPGSILAQEDVDALKKKLDRMAQEMEQVQQKVDELEKKNLEKEEEIEEIDDRLNEAELHTATDRLSFSVELRTRGDSLHYSDIQMAPASFTNLFFEDVVPGPGFNGATLNQIQTAIGNLIASGGGTAYRKIRCRQRYYLHQ